MVNDINRLMDTDILSCTFFKYGQFSFKFISEKEFCNSTENYDTCSRESMEMIYFAENQGDISSSMKALYAIVGITILTFALVGGIFLIRKCLMPKEKKEIPKKSIENMEYIIEIESKKGDDKPSRKHT